jgi:glycosyltransferase involved in cell wall biosynthesis
MYSLIIPVYKNAENIPHLMIAMNHLNTQLNNQLEIVFVVDGSPDDSFALLNESLTNCHFRAKLVLLSRNFGSYAAIRAGLEAAEGDFFAVMAADLQEPPELIIKFFECLQTEPIDVVFGIRESRHDAPMQQFLAKTYWYLYKKLVLKDMPPGGIDIFGCNSAFRNQLLTLNESNSSLIGLAFWLGFKRKMIGYHRLERQHGKSAWGLGKRLKYAMDSAFAFSDLPIKLLYLVGFTGIFLSIASGLIVFTGKLFGFISVPGYAATIITIGFFAALNSMGLGIIGSYVWRTFENTKSRPQSIIMHTKVFNDAQQSLNIASGEPV